MASDCSKKPRHVLFLLFTSFFFSSPVQNSLAATSNIETFYPSIPSPIFSPPVPLQSPPPPPPPPPTSPSTPTLPPKREVAKAVVVTATISFALWGLLFFGLYSVSIRRRELMKTTESNSKSSRLQLLRSKERLESVIVDKDGLDVIYLREFNGDQRKCDDCISKVLPSDFFREPFVSSCSRSKSTATCCVDADVAARKDHAEHSMAGNKIADDGSFRFEQDIMEAIFGTMAITNKKDPRGGSFANLGTSPTQFCFPEWRKADDIAIVLSSLAVSRQEICNSLIEGRGLDGQTLEKLSMLAPTKEQEDAIIRAYADDPSKLSDVEEFLFHVLRHVPAPFARVDVMLFMLNYNLEMLQLKKSLETLDLACIELRTPGLFPKLLGAVLTAGDLMSAGTARGNPQAFDLKALCKLAGIKSTDGSTTLLHFVVEEIVRAEGKRLVIDGNHSLRSSKSTEDGGANAAKLDRTMDPDERESVYMKLGLPIVGGLSDEFIKLKTAAGIDHDALVVTCPSLAAVVDELKRFLNTCDSEDGFTMETRSFVERAVVELRTTRAEQRRVLEMVKTTTENFQGGARRKDNIAHPFQLFSVMREFLGMVDMACIDITKNLQKKKQTAASAVTSTGTPQTTVPHPGISSLDGSQSGRRPTVRFPYLPLEFMSTSDASSDEDDEEYAV